MMWVKLLRGAYVVNNLKKDVENSESNLDISTSKEFSKESSAPGSPYLTRPLRSLDEAIAELGLDRHADLLNRDGPKAQKAVLLRLPAPSTFVAGTTATTSMIDIPTLPEHATIKKVANLK